VSPNKLNCTIRLGPGAGGAEPRLSLPTIYANFRVFPAYSTTIGKSECSHGVTSSSLSFASMRTAAAARARRSPDELRPEPAGNGSQLVQNRGFLASEPRRPAARVGEPPREPANALKSPHRKGHPP
jgi:hypothetical protein